MRNAWIIASKDIREAFRSRTTYLYIIVLVFVAFSIFNGLSLTLKSLSQQAVDKAALVNAAQTALGVMISTIPLVFNMLFSSFLSNYAVVTYKTKRVLESLLATPMSLYDVWFGKSLAITMSSVLISFGLSVIALVLMNTFFVVPLVGSFVWPPVSSMITGWVLVPIISILVTLAVTLFQLILSNPRVANFAFMLIFLGVFIIPTVAVLRSLNIEMIYLLLISGLVVLDLILSRFLTKERVVLSSKG